MIEQLKDTAQLLAIAVFGLAAGGAWIAAVVAPNTSYDRLDDGRADGHVRTLLVSSSAHISTMLLVAAALAFFAGAIAAGSAGCLAAFGFFTNRLTLSAYRQGRRSPGQNRRKTVSRVVAVSLTLIFTLVILVAIGLTITRT